MLEVLEFWDMMMVFIEPIFISTIAGMSAWHLIVGLIVLSFCLIARNLFAKIVVARLRYYVQQTETDIDDKILRAVREPLKFIPIIIGVFSFSYIVDLPPGGVRFVEHLTSTLIVFVIFWTVFNIITPLDHAINILLSKLTHDNENLFAEDFTPIITKILKIAVVVIGSIVLLSQWDIDVWPFITGLGVIGMALGLAAQDILKNIIGGVKVLLDGIYRVGNWIEVDGTHGTVFEIGIATTKLRAFDKAVISIPNGIMANAEIKNWSRMTNRRIKMTIGVEYKTTITQIENVISRIRKYLLEHPEIEQPGNAPVAQMVHLVEFGDSSININLYYFTKTTNWSDWRAIKSENMQEFMRIMEDEGVGFAFPSQSLYIESTPTKPVTPNAGKPLIKHSSNDLAVLSHGEDGSG